MLGDNLLTKKPRTSPIFLWLNQGAVLAGFFWPVAGLVSQVEVAIIPYYEIRL